MSGADTLKAIPLPQAISYRDAFSKQEINAQNLRDLKNLTQEDQLARNVFKKFRDLQKGELVVVPGRELPIEMEEELNTWCEQAFGTNEYNNRVNALRQIEHAYLTNATDLILYYPGLGTLPESIGRLTSLTELSVRNSDLTHLPDTIGNLLALRTLDIAHNRLENLPATFSNLTSLEELFLHNNRFTIFPEVIRYCVHLENLALQDNQIHDIPLVIANCPHHLYINMNNNLLTQQSVRNFRNAIAEARAADPTHGPDLYSPPPPLPQVQGRGWREVPYHDDDEDIEGYLSDIEPLMPQQPPMPPANEDWFVPFQQQANTAAFNAARQQAEEGALFLKEIMDDMLSTMSAEEKNEFYEKVESSDIGLIIELTQKATAKALPSPNPPLFYTETINSLTEDKLTFDGISTQLQRSVDFRASLIRAFELIIQARPPAA